MKVSELEGAALEYWFARATGKCDVGGEYEGSSLSDWISLDMQQFWWSDIGPIIEQYDIELTRGWAAHMERKSPQGSKITLPGTHAKGATPIIAVMRCVVASKFGEEVTEERIAA